MAQIKSANLMVVPSTADGFRAAVPSWERRCWFDTFSLPEDRCARLLVKNLGRGMPKRVVREDLEYLNIRAQGVTQLRSGPRQGPPSHPQFIVSVAQGPEVSKV